MARKSGKAKSKPKPKPTQKTKSAARKKGGLDTAPKR
jgi:hypothetical protein